ncbi:MAG: hypothetical protein II855_04160, partial [Candidatus Methanomethylophilaceae archaeon]|nr:hypothetical protein [Candidatus Methanomethylophilaceae archaeon]
YVMSVVLKPGVNDIGPADVSTYITGQKGSGGGSEGNTVVHPYPSYNSTTWLSDGPVTYNGSMGYSYNWTYFNKDQDPTEDIKKVINCEMSFDDLKTVTPAYGNDYWILGYGNMETQFNKNYFVTEPTLLYLEKGTWNINIANTNCDYLRLVNANQLVGGRGDSESITLSEGKGTLEIELERPTAFYFDNGGGSFGWLEYTVEYNINPDLSYDVITDFPKTANIVTNYQWVKSTSVNTVDGKINISNMYDNSLLFVSGSPEEAAFITNVVNKNLMDGSEYRTEYLDVYNQKIVSYTIRETSRDLSDYLYLSIDRSHGNVYTGESIDVDSERIPTGEQTNSKFYAGKHFSIAVSYDTSRIMYVAIGFTTVFGEVDYAPLQSGRLYEFDMESAAEYELYAVLKNGENDMSPLEVGIYTSGLSEEDNYGTVFAIVAIAFCVLAFGTLFMAGRRPKWNDNTGLPDFDASTPESPSVDTDVPEDVTPESTEDK